ncbi:hypothetical protein HK405_003633, partial [Cladochytrium tenue]
PNMASSRVDAASTLLALVPAADAVRALVGASATETRSRLRRALAATDDVTPELIDAEVERRLLGAPADTDRAAPTPTSPHAGRSAVDRLFDRARLLDALDRLETFDAIFGPRCPPPPAALAAVPPPLPADPRLSFRQRLLAFLGQSILDVARDAAARGHVYALDVLFTRHGATLLPFRLPVLSLLPLGMDPALYRALLPAIDAASGCELPWPIVPWRSQPDWIETNDGAAALLEAGLQEEEDDDEEDEAEASMSVDLFAKHPQPLTADELTSWFVARIVSIETSSGLVDYAVALCKIAVANVNQASRGLSELLHHLSTLSDLVYGCGHVLLDLGAVRSMDCAAVVDAFLIQSGSDAPHLDPDEYAWRLRTYVLPFCSRAAKLGAPESELNGSIDAALIRASKLNLDFPARVFEMSRDSLPIEDRIISSDVRLASLIIDCAYAAEGAGCSLETYNLLVRCLPKSITDRNSAKENADPEFLSSLAERMSLLVVHVDALGILNKYKLQSTLRHFLDPEARTEAHQKQTLLRMARVYCNTSASDAEWLVLMDDLIYGAGLGLFGDVSSSTYITPPEAEPVILEASREFYDNAPGCDLNTDLRHAMSW